MKNIDSTSKFLHATIFHHQAVAVGEDRREGFVVADNDDGHIGTLLAEGVIKLLPVEGIEVGIWLVKQEKFGPGRRNTRPASGADNPARRRKRVVLPPPLGPWNIQKSSGLMVRDTPESTDWRS